MVARRSVPLATSLPFVASFVAFEVGLYVSGYLLPGAEGAFTSAVVGEVFRTEQPLWLDREQWELFEESSHMPHVEEPKAFLDRVEEFLRTID